MMTPFSAAMVLDQDNSLCKEIINNNGYIINWILHQIIMYSHKVKLVAGENNNPPIHTYILSPTT